MSYMYKEFTIQHKIISYTNLFLYLSVLKKKNWHFLTPKTQSSLK